MHKLRIMNWNIEKLGKGRAGAIDPNELSTLVNLLARVIHRADVDIAVIVEIQTVSGNEVLQCLTRALNTVAGTTKYSCFMSEPSGIGQAKQKQQGGARPKHVAGERYGFIIKDLDEVRPLALKQVAGAPDIGTRTDPIRNLNEQRLIGGVNVDVIQFETVPGTFSAHPVAYELGVWPAARIPVVDLYVNPLTKSINDPPGGDRDAGAGTAGTQSQCIPTLRLPCLAMFRIKSDAGPIVALLVDHFKSGQMALTKAQIRRLKALHVAQKLAAPVDAHHNAGVLVDHGIEDIENLIVLGDFNLDLLRASAGGSDVLSKAYGTITNRAGHSGTATTTRGAGGGRITPHADPPASDAVCSLELNAAVTTSGTIMHPLMNSGTSGWSDAAQALEGKKGSPLSSFMSACYDNFFFRGDALGTVSFLNGSDAGEVMAIPLWVGTAGFEFFQLAHERALRGCDDPCSPVVYQLAKSSDLDDLGRLAAARWLSDHLPVIVEFDVPVP
jgi:hypothetical protein